MVVWREGPTTPLTRNVRLVNDTKVNCKSGIVKFPDDKLTKLKESDFLWPDGGLVFAMPGSAAAARGNSPASTSAAFNTYTCPPAPCPAVPQLRTEPSSCACSYWSAQRNY